MVSSARNPNESYAQRAKKASTSSSNARPAQQNQLQHQQSHHVGSNPAPPSNPKHPLQVNVWAERIKAHSPPQPSEQPPADPPQPPRDDPIQPGSSPSDLSSQLAILDQQDEHDPFVVRVPPHLSRQSSSSTNPLPPTDPSAWPHLPVPDKQSQAQGSASSTSYDSPFLSAVPSRQDSTASFRQHAYSAGSVRLSRVQSSLSQHSHSASHSRTQSRSGSSASSPRLQIHGRTLPQDDSLPPDLRLDDHHRRSSNQRSSPALPDPPSRILTSFQPDPVPPADPYYQRPILPSQDMHHHFTQYHHFSPSHVPSHTPPYIPPHSGQGTPPYPHYSPYPAYIYGHHTSLFWGDVPPPHSHTHFQNQPLIPSNYINPSSEHPLPHTTEFGSISPTITIESSKEAAHSQNGLQPRPSKSVVFGTINLPDPQSDSSVLPLDQEQPTDAAVEHVTEQFTGFSIGVGPEEHGPPRLASRKPSVRSLSKSHLPQPNTDDRSKDTTVPPSREANGSATKSIKWEFGTTLTEDLEEPHRLSSPSPSSLPPPDPQVDSVPALGQPDIAGGPPSQSTSPIERHVNKSETESSTSDVWVVKDYGYGFGEHSGFGNAFDIVRQDMREREKERTRELIRDRDRNWIPVRQSGWRYRNGNEEGREGWEQPHADAVRPRRGSFPGYGGHERGGFSARRGRGYAGRFHGSRGRGGFFHHHRPGSYSYAPPPPPPPPPLPPFEMLPPAVDMVNGYGHSSYAPPELDSYEAVAPASQPPFTPVTYSVDAMRDCLLGQLEYYLSPQNMAQDLYLRQRMDDEGWIPISLLASFKRVQQLQMDADIVREVLSRSGVVEMNGSWVRMGGRQWELFVLPNAPRSVVAGVDHGDDKSPMLDPHHDSGAYPDPGEFEGENGETEGECDGEDCEGDDEDDDIEFVIGEEAEGSWMSVAERKQ